MCTMYNNLYNNLVEMTGVTIEPVNTFYAHRFSRLVTKMFTV